MSSALTGPQHFSRKSCEVGMKPVQQGKGGRGQVCQDGGCGLQRWQDTRPEGWFGRDQVVKGLECRS